MKTIRIDGVIGDWQNTVDEIKWRVDALGLEEGEPLTIIINSPGGSVFEGFAIYNYFLTLPREIFTEIEGLCGSIATLIAMSAPKANTSISEVSMYMVHKASVGVQGNSDELIEQAEILNSIDQTLISVYSARTLMTRNEVTKLLDNGDTWYNAKDAVKAGFVKNLINKVDSKMAAIAHNLQINTSMKILSDLLAKYKGNAATPPVVAEIPAGTPPVVEEIPAGTPPPVAEIPAGTPPVVEEIPVAETTQYVTAEQFEKLSNLVTDLLTVMGNQPDAKTVAAEVAEAVFTAKVKGLPTSGATPPTGQANFGAPPPTYTPKHAQFKNRMDEIDKATRRT